MNRQNHYSTHNRLGCEMCSIGPRAVHTSNSGNSNMTVDFPFSSSIQSTGGTSDEKTDGRRTQEQLRTRYWDEDCRRSSSIVQRRTTAGPNDRDENPRTLETTSGEHRCKKCKKKNVTHFGDTRKVYLKWLREKGWKTYSIV